MRRREIGRPADARFKTPMTGQGYHDGAGHVMLRRGALSDVEAKLHLMPRNVLHLWALGDLVAAVSDGLGRTERVCVTGSPEPRS